MKSIKIRNRWTGSVVFEYTKEENTITETVLEAIRRGANLCGADLRGADLCGADLSCADLRDANLYDADLRGTNLCDAKGCYLSCPTEGSFIGWKKASGKGSRLNPRYVAQMMGFPPDWTELPFRHGAASRSKPTATP